tara:strand:- start:308 stop:688 length:381 start_codon:yes stop_codon:yes gene_type:complete
MSRGLRNLQHGKQGRIHIGRGVPNVKELEEATPVLRSVGGIGIVEYIKYNGQLYSSVYYQNNNHVKLDTDKITTLHDGTFGDESFPGTVSDTINDTTANVQDDLASLAAKINSIIRVLRNSNIADS